MPRPAMKDYPIYFDTYIKLIEGDDVLNELGRKENLQVEFFKNIPEEKHLFAYAPSKWTLKEMLQHIIDTERIFGYRALAFARKDVTALPGFDENFYASNSKANDRTWLSLCEELEMQRKLTVMLFQSFHPDSLAETGSASGNNMTVNAAGYIICGHVLHHKNVIMERYL